MGRPETMESSDALALKIVEVEKQKTLTRGSRAKQMGEKKNYKSAQEAKANFLDFLMQGCTVKEATSLVGRSHQAYTYWRRTDAEFREVADKILGRRRRDRPEVPTEVPDFPEFCEKYLGFRLHWHQLQWFDILEGREPRDLHPAQMYVPGFDPHLLLINTPPNHAKSTTITVAYVVWRIVKDPNCQVVIVSKNESMAKKFLYQIKDILTSRTFQDLQLHFGPDGGWEETSNVWSSTQIYFGSKIRDENAKDPTIEAVGMLGQIYGARADLIILDDCIETTNAPQFEAQIDWITRMVLTRPTDHGKVLVVGTRVAPVDLYGELMNKARYDDGESPWTYFAQPAVLEFADDPEDWVTLWPRSNKPKRGAVGAPDEDGTYPAWDGPSLNRMRGRLKTNPNAWAQGYQQEAVHENAVFSRAAVYGCAQQNRTPGLLSPNVPGGPPGGMTGLHVIAGLDPASAGHTAAVVMAIDPSSQMRYVLDVHNQAEMTPDQVRELMLRWTDKYGIREWRIEKVLLSNWITQDRELQKQLATRGVAMVEHVTGRNKWDVDAGVMSLASLFQGYADGNNLISLPATRFENIRTMCEQLIAYFPQTKGKTDILMALWFCEIRAREIAAYGTGASFNDSPWLSDRDRAQQILVDIEDLDQFQTAYWA